MSSPTILDAKHKPTKPMQLWLVRHGETEWSTTGQHTGRTDLPLTLEGKFHARQIAGFLNGRGFALVLTSPLERARETCRLAGYGERAIIDANLREWDYGEYEGRTTPEIQIARPGWSLWRDGVIGGECIEQVAARAQNVIDRAVASSGDALLFAHGHILRVLTACWLGLPPETGRLFALGTKVQIKTQPREAEVSSRRFHRGIPLATWSSRGRTPDSTPEYLRKRRKTKKEKHMIRTNVWMNLLTSVLLTAVTAFAQSSDRLPVTDAEKIADALRAGPAFITKDATVLDWPSAPGGEYRLLRKGSNEWTCLPAIPGYPHDEPGCFDPIFLRWMQDSLAGRTPHIDRIGISYMYFGAWQSKDGSSGHEFHVGPHLMIVSPRQDDFQGFNRDPSNGMPYVAHLPHRTELYLVMPARQWDE
jgi:probable phosphoglycerate mutase